MSASSIVDGLEQLSTTSTSRHTTPSRKKSPKKSTSVKTTPAPEKSSSTKSFSFGSSSVQVLGFSPLNRTLVRTLKTLHDFCPKDEPLEHDITYGCKDVRGLGPLTIQYRALKPENYINDCSRQDQVIEALRSRVGDLLVGSSASDERPAVVFDYTVVGTSRFATIKLSFSTSEAFWLVRKGLLDISIGLVSESATSYWKHCWSNTLAGNLLAVDILRLSEQEAATKDFMASVRHMFFGVGQVLGVGAIMLASESSKTIPANIIRVYVKLNHALMKLSFADFVERIPTDMRWKGVLYTMCWAGRDTRKHLLDSLDYPDQLPTTSSR